jgi:catechol 2,3-dioxygenase-like lactoylglutathione lyase family enzyme
MPLRISGVVTVEIPVADIPRSIEWYAAVLGFRRTFEGAETATLAAPEGVTLRLLLVRTDDLRRHAFTNTSTGVEHGVIDFKTADLAACHRALKERGFPVGDLKPGAHGFGFEDPDGNRLGLCDI